MVEIIRAMLNSLAFSFDIPILNWIQANCVSEFMDNFWYTVTLFGEGGVFWIACAVLLLALPQTSGLQRIVPNSRRTGAGMAIAMVLGLLICNLLLKPWIARPRPYVFARENFQMNIWLLTGELSDFSFPSGHTIASFEASVVLLKSSKKVGIPALILAFLVSLSRLYLYVHYPTDVIFSMILGTIFALIGSALAKYLVPAASKKHHGKFERTK